MLDIDAIWPQIREAFAHYGVETRAKLSKGRRKILQRHLDDEIELEELPLAVHGYVWQHKGFDTRFTNGQTSGDYFRFETVYKLDKMELRVELGARGPWVFSDAKVVHQTQVKARQAAAQKRVQEARARINREQFRVVGGG